MTPRALKCNSFGSALKTNLYLATSLNSTSHHQQKKIFFCLPRLASPQMTWWVETLIFRNFQPHLAELVELRSTESHQFFPIQDTHPLFAMASQHWGPVHLCSPAYLGGITWGFPQIGDLSERTWASCYWHHPLQAPLVLPKRLSSVGAVSLFRWPKKGC